jgi:hypothetical protein
MILAAILVCLSEFLAVFCGCLLIRRIFHSEKAELEAKYSKAFHDLVDARQDKDGKPQASQLADMLQVMGAVVGQSVAESFMARANADQSHVARQANLFSDELQGTANPLMGLAFGGKRGKMAAVKQLGMMLQGVFKNNGNGSGGAGVSGTNFKMEV